MRICCGLCFRLCLGPIGYHWGRRGLVQELSCSGRNSQDAVSLGLSANCCGSGCAGLVRRTRHRRMSPAGPEGSDSAACFPLRLSCIMGVFL